MVPVRPFDDLDDADDPHGAVRAVLATLAVSARDANLARTAVLEEAVSALDAGRLAAVEREAAVRAAHQVVGSAGTFGRHRSSQLAAELERWFRDTGDATGRPTLERVRAQLAELRADLAGPAPDGDHQDEV